MSKKPDPPSGNAGDADKPGDPVKACPLGELLVIVKTEDGDPVKDAEVSAGALGKKTTDAGGAAHWSKIKAGTYDVTAAKPGHGKTRAAAEGPDGKTGVSVPEGGKTTVNLIQHPLCANVCFFEGSKTRAKYFGFDHKTDRPTTPGTDEYWLPTPDRGALAVPADRFKRDGARWVSVAKDKEAEVEINFAFKGADCPPCIRHTTFSVAPASVAEVRTATITAKKAVFRIKGKGVGEATLKAVCDGKDVGWFHIWCQTEAEIKIDVVNVITNRAPADSWSLAALRTAFKDIFDQCALKVDIADLGSVDLSGDAVFTARESTGYPSGPGRFLLKTGSPPPYNNKAAVLNAMDAKAGAILSARTTGTLPRADAYRIYRYVPTAGCAIGGTVLNIGSSPAFTFMSDGASARNSIAHEFGHCLGLRHPSDGSSGPQFVAHCRDTRNQTVPAYAATNTEVATDALSAVSADGSDKAGNIMAADPTNLMGYWPEKAKRKYLRYHQWKAISRS